MKNTELLSFFIARHQYDCHCLTKTDIVLQKRLIKMESVEPPDKNSSLADIVPS